LVRDALLRTRPHVVHANTLLSLPEAAIARSCGLPVVLQLHEIPPPGAKRTAALRAAGRVADVVVAVSDAVAAMARPHLGRTPVVVVRNGVPVAPARIEPGAAPFFVGTVGTVSDVKGTDVLLRAARIVVEQRPSIRFEHAGDPSLHRDAGLDETLARLRAELPEGTFELLGPRPADEVLPRWHVFAFPSRSEAFPLATLEAMAAGVPVVASAVGGIPEQIADEHGGLVVPPGDADALAAAIVRLHDDGGLRRRLAAAAAERVRREFTLAQQAEGLHRAYLAAIDLRFAPPPVRQHVRAAL
jgi:glycosyltransferase involved in cell wall biosynthesis